MRLLVSTLVFPPDGVSTSQLLGELVEDFAKDLTCVEIVTTSPHYNTDEVAINAQKITWAKHGLIGQSKFNGIDVTHIKINGKAKSKLGRMAQWAWFHLASFIIIISKIKHFDAMFCVSPPPTTAVVCAIVKKFTGKKFSYAIWELYPDILVNLQIIKPNSYIYKFLKYIEIFTYKNADLLFVLHDAMAESVTSTYPPALSNTYVVPTFADTEFLRPIERPTTLEKEWNVEGKFVVLYAGNMGKPQQLMTVIDAAKHCEHNDKIVFVLVGDGSERTAIENRIYQEKINNVKLLEHLPYAQVPTIYGSCDISLVPLAENISSEALPSKVYRSLACGKPIGAICSVDSPLHKLVVDHGIGFSCETNNPKLLAEKILNFQSNILPSNVSGNNARKVATEKFSRQAVSQKYLVLVNSLAG